MSQASKSYRAAEAQAPTRSIPAMLLEQAGGGRALAGGNGPERRMNRITSFGIDTFG